MLPFHGAIYWNCSVKKEFVLSYYEHTILEFDVPCL